MTSIPTNISRVPNLLGSQIILGSLVTTQQSMLELQVQLASGKKINRTSDDAISASLIASLDNSIERREQRQRNLSHAESVLNTGEAALADASRVLLEAKGIGLSQIGVGSDAETRDAEAKVIDAILDDIFGVANRQFQDIYLFGGNVTDRPPVVELLGGMRYQGDGAGMLTDLGMPHGVAITTAGERAFGALSARVEGQVDLDPQMIGSMRLSDLNGARGLGIAPGSVNVDVDGTDITVDLTGAHTVQDVIDELTAAIDPLAPGLTIQIDPVTGNRFEILPAGGETITITDPEVAATAADLGLATVFPGAGATGADVDPRLTELTPLTSLGGVTLPLGTIRLANAGQTRDLDLSGAANVQDVMNAVKGLNIGIRAEISDAGDRLNFINELSGGDMSIGEVGGGASATELGVRSLAGWTRLEDFNNGLGVQIRSGSVDPVTGAPDPAADLDFRITLKDAREMDVDLAGAETVQDVLDAINAAATAAGVTVPAEFQATLVPDGNGIRLTDSTLPGTNDTVVEALNGSFAATDLGLVGTSASANLDGEDRATVAVESVFSHLIALRDALERNDERGIEIATSGLDRDLTRLAEARADIGGRSRRVTEAVSREEDLRIQEFGLRSEVQDLDFTEAAIRFATLQQQLQAGLATAGQVLSLSLLDFLR